MVVVLEVSASRRAKCRAEDDCIYLEDDLYNGNFITDDVRICVCGAESLDWFGRTKHFYHVQYFSSMVDLRALLPENFKMGVSSGRWGLMVEKWFEHKGCIDLERITTFFGELEACKQQHADWTRDCLEWHLNHHCKDHCKGSEDTCSCPSEPQPPKTPILGDCSTGDEDSSALVDVLNHRLVTDRRFHLLWMLFGGSEREPQHNHSS